MGAGLQNALEALVNEELTRDLRQSQYVQSEQRALKRTTVANVHRCAARGLLLRWLLILVSLDLLVARIVAFAAPPPLRRARRARSRTATLGGRRLGLGCRLEERLHRLEQRVQLLRRQLGHLSRGQRGSWSWSARRVKGHKWHRTRLGLRASSGRRERTSIEMDCIVLREGGGTSSPRLSPWSCSSCLSRSCAWPSPIGAVAPAWRLHAAPTPRAAAFRAVLEGDGAAVLAVLEVGPFFAVLVADTGCLACAGLTELLPALPFFAWADWSAASAAEPFGTPVSFDADPFDAFVSLGALLFEGRTFFRSTRASWSPSS